MRPLFLALRLAGAAAIVAAIVGQLITSIRYWTGTVGLDDIGTPLVGFFSFFTIDSNVLSVATLLVGAVLLARSGAPEPRGFGVLRAAVTAYMATTGVVYNMLLRGIELPQGATLAWSNEVLHVVGPVLVVLDWLLAPGRARLEWRHIWAIVAFPVVWAVYTMVRGPLTFDPVLQRPFWYPYPFLDPNASELGYVSVVFYVIVIAAFIGGVGAAVIWTSRRPSRRWPLPGRR